MEERETEDEIKIKILKGNKKSIERRQKKKGTPNGRENRGELDI